MNKELSSFAARLREKIFSGSREGHEVGEVKNSPSQPSSSSRNISDKEFSKLALELFALQFQHNSAYRKICEARKLTPQIIEHWTQIPAVPTSAFKELELTSLAPAERTAVFHSSGTTEQKPSRHFHCAESLAVYEASLWPWFEQNVLRSADGSSASSPATRGRAVRAPMFLTPPPAQAPHSSLVHMFEVVREKMGAAEKTFLGQLDANGPWTLDFDAVLANLGNNRQSAIGNRQFIFGTAFSFVHLLDFLAEKNLKFTLPPGSRVLETGGYKNRSRTMPKDELHALITERLGVPRENIICEYGMSELSSQAYAGRAALPRSHGRAAARPYHFPPWARVQIISPETGREVAEGETGLIRIFDLANVFSVAAIQAEDLGVRRGDGFELLGRAQLAEPRGCSLMTA